MQSVNLFIPQPIGNLCVAIAEGKWVKLAVCFEHSMGMCVLEAIVLDVGASALNDAQVGLVLHRHDTRL